MIRILNYINGALVAPENAAFLPNPEPATGIPFSEVPDSTETDVALAVNAAQAAFDSWSNATAQYRSNWLMKLAHAILAKSEQLALAESRDNGKPVWLARKVDIPRAASNFEFFATAILHFASESHFMEGAGINYTLRRPVGVAGCISPWNLPLYLFTWKIAPALAAGNTVVAKPSEVTPYTAYLLSEICVEIGFPAGVLNIVHGLGAKAGHALVAHPSVKMISFTGGTQTGAAIARTAAPQFKKLSLELGGKNPTLVFEDADFEKTLDGLVRSAFTNQGQICLCGSRVLIERSCYNRYKNALIEKVNAIQVGDPTDETNFMGAIVSKAHLEKIEGAVAQAQKLGGTIVAGGIRPEVPAHLQQGWYYRPTIIEGLPMHCSTNQEEIFGPVITLTPFDAEAEAIELANSTGYGLAASVWTQDLNKAHRLSEKLQSGIVWVNCWMVRDLRTPFGGVKASGVGREGGWEALRFFTEPKNVCIQYH